jgi:hypothetical protein
MEWPHDDGEAVGTRAFRGQWACSSTARDAPHARVAPTAPDRRALGRSHARGTPAPAVQAQETSRPILERCGFAVVCTMYEVEHDPL